MRSRDFHIQAMLAGLMLCAWLLVAKTTYAQQPDPAPPPATQPAAQSAPAGAAAPYPPDPNGFVPGNRNTGQRGNYFSLWRVLPSLLLFLYWTNTSNWVNQ